VQARRIELEVLARSISSVTAAGGDFSGHLPKVRKLVGGEFVSSVLRTGTSDPRFFSALEKRLLDDRAELKSIAAHKKKDDAKYIEVAQRIANTETFLRNVQHRLDSIGSDPQTGKRLVELLNQTVQNMRLHELALHHQFQAAEGEVLAMNNRLMHVAIAQREVTLLRSQRELLLARIAKINVNSNQGRVRLAPLKAAILPRTPESPSVAVVAIASMVLGLVFTMLAVCTIELFDARFRTPAKFKQQFDSRFAGINLGDAYLEDEANTDEANTDGAYTDEANTGEYPGDEDDEEAAGSDHLEDEVSTVDSASEVYAAKEVEHQDELPAEAAGASPVSAIRRAAPRTISPRRAA